MMRLLDQAKIPYVPHSYDPSIVDGVGVAAALSQNPAATFKTLVTVSDKKRPYVFVIPVAMSLDLKKAARVVSVKSVSMLPQKELLGLTGYIHGGCSPVGMKKKFPTVFHKTVLDFPSVCFSAGRVGFQVEVDPKTVLAYIAAQTADIVVEEHD